MSEILRIENISKSFGSQKVLDNISLSINAGEIFSMLGPSGCGKSTLLRICGGFEEPDEGRIILDGVDITAFLRTNAAFIRCFKAMRSSRT